jgi:hypothetical protein
MSTMLPTRFIAAGLAGAGCVAVENWTRQTRATSGEKHKPLPGDALVSNPMWQATRATTVHAPRAALWPWLVQMGYPTHRAGWYTPYWMDRLIFGIRAHSADCIVPELQTLSPGDRVPDSPDAVVSYFEVAEIETNQALVLISHTHPLPIYRDVNFSWAFILEDLGVDTRLIMRARISYAPVGPALVVRLLIVAGFGVGDIVQAGAMLAGIKTRAESRTGDAALQASGSC